MSLCWSILLVAVMVFLVLIHLHSALFSIFVLLWMNEKLFPAAVHLFSPFSHVLSVLSSISPSFLSVSISFLSLSLSAAYTSLCCLLAKFLQQKNTGGNRCFLFYEDGVTFQAASSLLLFSSSVFSVFQWLYFDLWPASRSAEKTVTRIKDWDEEKVKSLSHSSSCDMWQQE